MRMLLTLGFGAVVLAAIALPASYFLLERDLPPLVTREEVLHTLKIYVEGQRQQEFAGVDPRLVEPFVALKKDDLSPSLLAGALATQGCPDYFTLPKEEGQPWLARVIGYGTGGGFGGPGPGNCEIQYADRLAGAIGLPSDAHRAIAIHELHGALTKEELLDLELSSRYFAPGILGVRAAAKVLFGKDARTLDLAETAELLLAERDWPEVKECKNPLVLKPARDNVINMIAGFNLAKKADAERAKGEKLRCLARLH